MPSKPYSYYKERRLKLRKWFKEEVLAKLKCEKCGETHPGCLDFHHKDEQQKDLEVTRLLHLTRSKTRVLKEIAKCEVLCANCHRKHHFNARLAQLEEASDLKPES